MRANVVFVIGLLSISTIAAVGPGCDDSLEFSNTPPGGLTISKNICYLGPFDSVDLIGTATDADGDSISYSWTAAEGTLTPADGKGRMVTWQAPDSHGTYRVTLHVTDGLDASSKGIDLDVGRNLDIVHDGGVIDQTDYPYIVPNALPINISGLITVTIEAGVTIIFNESGGGFNVSGELIINGTAQDRILFAPNRCPDDDNVVWKGIRFNGGEATGTLSYVTLTSSSDGITVENAATLTADNIIIDQTTATGLSVNTGASAVITDSRMWDNGTGISVEYATIRVENSSIRYNNNYGFKLLSSASTIADILSCVIANNGQYGLLVDISASPVVNNCSLFFNGTMTEIRTVGFTNTYSNTDPVDMTGNYWGTDNPLDIPPQIIRAGANGFVDYSGWLSEDPLGN
jgi:hypothetical protein